MYIFDIFLNQSYIRLRDDISGKLMGEPAGRGDVLRAR